MAQQPHRLPWKALAAFAFANAAQAVVLQGVVRDPLGRPVPFANIRLLQGQRNVGIAISGQDGTYEIRSSAKGRFVLVTTASRFAPGISRDFYGGSTSVVTYDIRLDPASVQPVEPSAWSGFPTPVAQLTVSSANLPADSLRTRVGLLDELALAPGAVLVQSGQIGSPAALLLRGGDAAANKITLDGVSVEDIGGYFDLGPVASTALADTEVLRNPDSALYGSGAEAGVVRLSTAHGTTLRPAFDFSGDAGNLHTWRNEAILAGTRQRLDYLAAYSRFDTSNALRFDRFHASTAVANLGYSLATNTQARFTLRNADTASGLPDRYDIYGIAAQGRQGDRNLYSALTLENRVAGNWHTVARYGIARKRKQIFQYAPVGQPFLVAGATKYYGNYFTLRGANGYTVSGRAAFDATGPSRQDAVSDRDELDVQTDYALNAHLRLLLGARYQNERGEFIAPALASPQHLQRVNFGYTLQFQGDIVRRVFYSLGGGIEKNHLLGLRGSPRLGLAYVPVRPSSGWLRGTKLRTSAATGLREPSLQDQAASFYSVLLRAGDTASIARYRVTPIDGARSRSFDVGVDQNIRGEKLLLRGSYFHNQFSHQIDNVDSGTLQTVFHIATSAAPFSAALNSLAYRTQGAELELEYQPKSRLYLRGGYTYLASLVEQSFSTDAASASAGKPVVNPAFPGIAIGASSPLVGARAFRRPPQGGFFALQYTGTTVTAAFQGSLSSRSDDSTYLAGKDLAGGDSLLLPNRNLDNGYAKLDAAFTYKLSQHITVFTQIQNLLDQQHMSPIGYASTPFTIRSGLKIRIGGE